MNIGSRIPRITATALVYGVMRTENFTPHENEGGSNNDKGAARNDYMNWRNGLYNDFASIIPNIELIVGGDRT